MPHVDASDGVPSRPRHGRARRVARAEVASSPITQLWRRACPLRSLRRPSVRRPSVVTTAAGGTARAAEHLGTTNHVCTRPPGHAPRPVPWPVRCRLAERTPHVRRRWRSLRGRGDGVELSFAGCAPAAGCALARLVRGRGIRSARRAPRWRARCRSQRWPRAHGP